MKKLKYGISALIVLFILLLFTNHCRGPTYKASFTQLPDLEIIATASQSGFLEEYNRGLIVKYKNEVITLELIQDTGGHINSNLFQLENGDYLFEGSIDCYSITLSPFKVIENKLCDKSHARYLGVFAFEKITNNIRGSWLFFDSHQKTYQSLFQL